MELYDLFSETCARERERTVKEKVPDDFFFYLIETSCVFGEMLFGRPVLQGNSDQDQLDKIFQLCGSPTEENMPGWSSLPGLEEKGVVYQVNKNYQRKLKEDFEPYGTLAADLMDKLLVLDPKKRLTAFSASDHDYLWVEPLPAEIGMYVYFLDQGKDDFRLFFVFQTTDLCY